MSGNMSAGQSSGTGALTEFEDEKVRKNDILSNRDKAQRLPGQSLDGKGIQVDEYKDNPANHRPSVDDIQQPDVEFIAEEMPKPLPKTMPEPSDGSAVELHPRQLEQSITDLGTAILKLKNEHQEADADIASELEKRYATLRKEYDALKLAETQSTVASARAAEAWENAKTRFSSAFNNFKDYATDEKTSQQWKQSAKEVGVGVGKAWGELVSSFQRAYKRIRETTKKPADKSDRHNKQ